MAGEDEPSDYTTVRWDPRIDDSIPPSKLTFRYTVITEDGVNEEMLDLGHIMSRYVAYKQLLEQLCDLYGWTMGEIEEFVKQHGR